MASADVTLGGSGREFEVDTTERTATLNSPGGWLRNTHATETAFVNTTAATVVTTQPVGAAGLTIKAGQSVALPAKCQSFTFKSGATTYLQYTKSPPTV